MLFRGSKPIEIKNISKKVNEIIKDYSFIDVLTDDDITKNEKIFENINESNFVMINQYIEENEHQKGNPHTYIVIGFKKTIINIEKSNFSILQPLLSFNSKINFCFLTKIDDINININDKSRIIDKDEDFEFKTEINNFDNELNLNHKCDRKVQKYWRFIRSCISGYLIKESYAKIKIDRLDNFINFERRKEIRTENSSTNEIPTINEDEFIELRDIGSGSAFKVVLIYHIEREELYAQEKGNNIHNGSYELTEREISNYSKVQHPLMPKFIGKGQNDQKEKYLIIEYINGQTLFSINELQLNFSEKITIFFELMIIIEFIHRKGFIYRDLKPNNIMIDENKTVVLIDFDRMIEQENSKYTTTNDFSSAYCAPEVNENDFSYECDIYSLGYIFLYIMNPNTPFKQSLNDILKTKEIEESEEIKEIISKSIKEDPKERPSIIEMIFKFYNSYYKYIQIYNLFDIQPFRK